MERERVSKTMEIKREIKFMAWDKKEKIMIAKVGEFMGEDLSDLIDNDDIVLMQYIGLKDLYEGDIIELQGHIISDRDKISKGVIFWDEEDACFKHTYEDRPPKRYWKHAKRIGNIYENPELLEDKI